MAFVVLNIFIVLLARKRVHLCGIRWWYEKIRLGKVYAAVRADSAAPPFASYRLQVHTNKMGSVDGPPKNRNPRNPLNMRNPHT